MASLPLTNLLSQSCKRKRTYRTLSAQYGDGYADTSPDGTNDVIDEWSLAYENLTLTDRNTVIAFLDANKGSIPWSWQAFGDSTTKTFKTVFDSVNEGFSAGNVYSISFTAKQVF